ncbi:MAG: hypothetical protein EOO88_23715, partial [Pedobacter sp.]
MATPHKPDPQNLLPQQPGGGQPVGSPSRQVVPVASGQQPTAQAVTRPARAIRRPAGPNVASYVDSLLFSEGIYRNQQDYDQAVADAVKRITS